MVLLPEPASRHVFYTTFLSDPVDPWLTRADIIPGQCPKVKLAFKVPTFAPLEVTGHIFTWQPCDFTYRAQKNAEVSMVGLTL